MKKGYSSFLSARVRHRPAPPVSLSPPAPDMTSVAAAASPPPAMSLADPTPIWIGAVMAGMQYEKELFEESQEIFFRNNPRVPRSASPHPLVPPATMVRHFLDQRYLTRVYFESLVPDPEPQAQTTPTQ